MFGWPCRIELPQVVCCGDNSSACGPARVLLDVRGVSLVLAVPCGGGSEKDWVVLEVGVHRRHQSDWIGFRHVVCKDNTRGNVMTKRKPVLQPTTVKWQWPMGAMQSDPCDNVMRSNDTSRHYNATLEYSVHVCPATIARELPRTFPSMEDVRRLAGRGQDSLQLNPHNQCELFVIPTFQPCESDLTSWGATQAAEKDRCLCLVTEWAKRIIVELDRLGRQGAAESSARPRSECECLTHLALTTMSRHVDGGREQLWWCDLADPVSGQAMFTRIGSITFSDVDCAEAVLRYPTVPVGGVSGSGTCRIIRHPVWGVNVYPATLVAWCPEHALLNALNAVNAGFGHSHAS